MDAKELRIDNWVVKQSSGQPYQVASISDTQITFIGGLASFINYISPIELTPEILEKAWFTKSDDEFGGWLSRDIKRVQPLTHIQVRIREDSNGYYYDSVLITRVQYLHQLQNLIFVLTNEELIINL